MGFTRSDVRPILADINHMMKPFDFTRQNLGRRVAEAAARGIMSFMEAELDPDGNPWAALSPKYLAWKEKVSPGAPISFLYGIMRTLRNLYGEVHVGPDRVEQTYGIEPKARTEAWKFTEGINELGYQPPRPFYELNAECEQLLDALFDAVWQDAEGSHPNGGMAE